MELGTGTAKLDLAGRTNQAFRPTLSFKDQNGAPIDLTGYAVSAQLRKKASDGSPVAQLSVSVSDAAGGLVTFDSDLSAVPGGDYVYDLLFVNGGVSWVPLAGKFRLEQGVTR